MYKLRDEEGNASLSKSAAAAWGNTVNKQQCRWPVHQRQIKVGTAVIDCFQEVQGKRGGLRPILDLRVKEMWTYRFKMLKHSCSFWTQRPVNSNRSQRCVRSLAIYAHHSQAYIWGNPHTFRPVTANQHLHLVLQSSPPREGRPLRSLSGRSSFDRSADVTQSSSGLLSEFSGISK